MIKKKVFISSVQDEFTNERKLLVEYFRRDALLQLFFEPFIFEEVPANTHSPGKIYLSEIEESDIYLGLLGLQYGYEDSDGISPTEHEYDIARQKNIQRWIFIKESESEKRHSKEIAFIRKIEQDVSRKIFSNFESLKEAVYRSCILFLRQNGFVDSHDFDNSLNNDATLKDIDPELIREFVITARAKRNFPLKETDPVEKVLTALKMIRNGKLINSALLVFHKEPQQFFPTATVKCAHFHGLKIEKPIPDFKEFGGTVFTMADSAVDFILSKISLSTGTRDESNRVDTIYEIPRRVIAEAVINAVAHRNYYSHSSIQVSIFKDRVEIVNPGNLPVELSLEDLKRPHNSYPHNPILADSLFLTGEIERYGTGTIDIYELTEEQNLKEPSFSLEEGFKLILWRPSATSIHDTDHVADHDTDHVADYVTDHDTDYDEELIKRLVLVCEGEMTRQELMSRLELKHIPNFRSNYLVPTEKLKFIEMTIPDKPRSQKQKYRLTGKGMALQKQLRDKQNK